MDQKNIVHKMTDNKHSAPLGEYIYDRTYNTSSVTIPQNENEKEYSVVTREECKPYNQLHMVLLYSIQSIN